MTEDDRRELADLALRALDTINEDYGEDAELIAACLTFEVALAPDDEGTRTYCGNYKSLERNSPHHLGGLLNATALHMLSPDEVDD